MFSQRLDGRSTVANVDRHARNVKHDALFRNDCNVEDKTDYISALDSIILKQRGA